MGSKITFLNAPPKVTSLPPQDSNTQAEPNHVTKSKTKLKFSFVFVTLHKLYLTMLRNKTGSGISATISWWERSDTSIFCLSLPQVAANQFLFLQSRC
jgi:hypothetical protein